MSDYMRYTTDIEQLLEEVKASLDMSVKDIPIYRHPLYVGFGLPDDLPPMGPYKNMGLRGVLTAKVAAFNKAVDEKDWERCLWITERPFRVNFLYELLDTHEHVNDADKAMLIKEAWTDSESPHVNNDVWRDWFRWLHQYLLDNPRSGGARRLVYSAGEWEAREKLIADKASPQDVDGTIIVYRGTCSNEGTAPGDERGLSWTLDREKAVWFATRFAKLGKRGIPLVLTGEVRVSRTIGPWLGRGENEMILPYGCTVMKSERVE